MDEAGGRMNFWCGTAQEKNTRSAMVNKDSKPTNDLVSCPCCGQFTLEEKGVYEICNVCGWEDDPVQSKESDYAGGANELSLNQYRKKYENGKSE